MAAAIDDYESAQLLFKGGKYSKCIHLDDLSPLYLPSEYPDAAFGAPGTLFKKEQAQRYLREVGELVRWLRRRISRE